MKRPYALALFAAAVLFPAVAADKPDFSGMWQAAAGSGSDQAEQFVIEHRDSELKITQKTPKMEIVCKAIGKECETVVNDEPAKVSYYFNGPTLVELLYEGKDGKRVTKTHRSLSPDGKKMSVEIIPLVPGGDTRKLMFERVQPNVASGPAEPHK